MTWIIGDIHGCYEELEALLAKIPPKDRLVFVGDYIDRGPASAAVIDRLLREKKRSIFLMGNHESMLLAFFKEPDSLEGQAWVYPGNGGIQTIRSYDLRPEALKYTQLPKKHRDFFEGLRPYHEDEDFIVVHAGVRVPGKSAGSAKPSMKEQEPEDLLWIRLDWINEEHRWAGKKIYYGHTPTRYIQGVGGEKSPIYGMNSVGIDTGCVYGGYLTALNTETGDLVQVRAKRAYI